MSVYGEESEWEEYNCEKCSEPVYLNESYIGCVMCLTCMDKEFPEDD